MEKNQNINMKYWPQIAGAVVVSLVWLSLGSLIGFVTIALPQLQNATQIQSITDNSNSTEDFSGELGSPIAPPILSQKAEIHNATHIASQTEGEDHLYLDQDLGSWFAAALLLAGIPFTPLGGLLGGIFGRRKIILLCQPFGIISWIIMANAQNIPTLFFSRFLSSVAITCHIASPGVYTAETVHPKIRNNLTILPSIFTSIGMLSVWIIGFFAHWRTTAYIFMIPHIVIFLCMLPLPESPYWLIEANKIDLAEKSLKFFRGPNYDITAEIDEIKEKRKSKVETQGEKISAKQILKKIFSKSFLKPFSCVGVIFVCSDWSGHNAFLTYMIKVLRDTGFTKSQAKIGPIIAGSIRLFLSGMIPFFVGRIKPKVLFITAQTLTTLALITVSVYSFIKQYHYYETTPEVENQLTGNDSSSAIEMFSWIPLVGMIMVNVLRGAGIEPVIHILINEMFPTEIRTLSIGLTQSAFLISGFTTVKTFPALEESIGLGGVCLLYASICFLLLLWGAYTIPDNRGKSLVKVEENSAKIMVATLQMKADQQKV